MRPSLLALFQFLIGICLRWSPSCSQTQMWQKGAVVLKRQPDAKIETEMEGGGGGQMGVSLRPQVYSPPFLSRKAGSHSFSVSSQRSVPSPNHWAIPQSSYLRLSWPTLHLNPVLACPHHAKTLLCSPDESGQTFLSGRASLGAV